MISICHFISIHQSVIVWSSHNLVVLLIPCYLGISKCKTAKVAVSKRISPSSTEAMDSPTAVTERSFDSGLLRMTQPTHKSSKKAKGVKLYERYGLTETKRNTWAKKFGHWRVLYYDEQAQLQG